MHRVTIHLLPLLRSPITSHMYPAPAVNTAHVQAAAMQRKSAAECKANAVSSLPGTHSAEPRKGHKQRSM